MQLLLQHLSRFQKSFEHGCLRGERRGQGEEPRAELLVTTLDKVMLLTSAQPFSAEPVFPPCSIDLSDPAPAERRKLPQLSPWSLDRLQVASSPALYDAWWLKFMVKVNWNLANSHTKAGCITGRSGSVMQARRVALLRGYLAAFAQ